MKTVAGLDAILPGFEESFVKSATNATIVPIIDQLEALLQMVTNVDHQQRINNAIGELHGMLEFD